MRSNSKSFGKRFLAWVLTLAMVVSLAPNLTAPTTAKADEAKIVTTINDSVQLISEPVFNDGTYYYALRYDSIVYKGDKVTYTLVREASADARTDYAKAAKQYLASGDVGHYGYVAASMEAMTTFDTSASLMPYNDNYSASLNVYTKNSNSLYGNFYNEDTSESEEISSAVTTLNSYSSDYGTDVAAEKAYIYNLAVKDASGNAQMLYRGKYDSAANKSVTSATVYLNQTAIEPVTIADVNTYASTDADGNITKIDGKELAGKEGERVTLKIPGYSTVAGVDGSEYKYTISWDSGDEYELEDESDLTATYLLKENRSSTNPSGDAYEIGATLYIQKYTADGSGNINTVCSKTFYFSIQNTTTYAMKEIKKSGDTTYYFSYADGITRYAGDDFKYRIYKKVSGDADYSYADFDAIVDGDVYTNYREEYYVDEDTNESNIEALKSDNPYVTCTTPGVSGDAMVLNDNDDSIPYYFFTLKDKSNMASSDSTGSNYRFQSGENTYAIKIPGVATPIEFKANWTLPTYTYNSDIDTKFHVNDYSVEVEAPGVNLTNTGTNNGDYARYKVRYIIDKVNYDGEVENETSYTRNATASNFSVELENEYSDYRYFTYYAELVKTGSVSMLATNSDYSSKNTEYFRFRTSGNYDTTVNYEVVGVSVDPISIDGDSIVYASGDTLSITPEVTVAKGYDVKYQWKKYNAKTYEYEDIANATGAAYLDQKYTAPVYSSYDEYELVATATMTGDTTKVYTATYDVEVYATKPAEDKPAYKLGEDSTWYGVAYTNKIEYDYGYPNPSTSSVLAVGESKTYSLGMVSADADVKFTYKWYKSEYITNASYDALTATQKREYSGDSYSGYYRYVSADATGTSYTYTPTHDDFVVSGDADSHTARIKLEVTKQKTNDKNSYVNSFYVNVSEESPSDLYDNYYDADETSYDSGDIVTKYAYAGDDVKIVAPSYKSNNVNYKVNYQWYKYTGVDASGNAVYKTTKLEGETSQTLEYKSVTSKDATSREDVENMWGYYYVVVTLDRVSATKKYSSVITIFDGDDAKYDINLEKKTDSKKNLYITAYCVGHQNQEVKLGGSVSLIAGAKVFGSDDVFTYSYKWLHDGKEISGATSSSLNLTNMGLEDYGTYYLSVTGTDTIDSNVVVKSDYIKFTVTEDTGVEITYPTEYTTYAYDKQVGDKVTFAVQAKSDNAADTLTYQWYKDGVEIAGATQPEYIVTVTDEDFGSTYRVEISNGRNDPYYDGDYRSYEIVEKDENSVYAVVYHTNNTMKTYSPELTDKTQELKIEAGSSSNYAGVTYKTQWYKEGTNGDYELIANASGDSYVADLTAKNVDGNFTGYGDYRCDVTFYKDGEELYITKKVYFTIEEPSEDISGIPNYDFVREYGYGAANRLGDSVKFGVEDDGTVENPRAVQYYWTFKPADADYSDDKAVQILANKTPVISINSLTDDDFGTYTLYVQTTDEEGNVVYVDEDGDTYSSQIYYGKFTLNKYTEGLTATIKDSTRTYYTYSRKIGDSVDFNVSATTDTDDEITYQWYVYDDYEWKAMYGVNTDSYSLSNLTREDFTKDYKCVVTCGDDTATVYFYLKLSGSLSVESNRYNEDHYWYYYRKLGTSVTFAPKATSDEKYAISYTWYKDGDVLDNTASSLAISKITADDYGTYECVVSNDFDDAIVCYYYLREDDGDNYLYFDNTVEDATKGASIYSSKDDTYKRVSTDTTYTVWYNFDEDYDDDACYKYQEFMTSVGAKVTANAKAISNKTVTYQWYQYNAIQDRYIKLDGQTKATLDITVTKDDLQNSSYDYYCEVSYADGVKYYCDVYLTEKDELVVKADKDAVIEGSKVTFTATLTPSQVSSITRKASDFTYQWYTYDDDNNLVAIEGATSSTYTVTAPKIERVNKANKYATQAMTQGLSYYCKVTYGSEASMYTISDYAYVTDVINPDTATAKPSASFFDGKSVQKIYQAGATSMKITFDSSYELGGTNSALYIYDSEGNVYEYGDYDGALGEVAGKTVTVKGDTAILVYYPFADEDDTIGSLTVADLIKVAAKNNHGYKVTSVTATYNKKAALKVSKSKLIIAKGKKGTLTYTANNAAGASVKATATSSNKKVTVKVSGNKITIAVNKKATMGTSATIKVSAAGKTSTVKVLVKNATKKVKAAKKSVKVKKGKTSTLKFTIKAANAKKATTDTVKVTSSNKKVVKVTKKKLSKSKYTVTIKAVKKGKAVITVKAGKKSAKTKVTVK